MKQEFTGRVNDNRAELPACISTPQHAASSDAY
jgi:hypothetical protein